MISAIVSRDYDFDKSREKKVNIDTVEEKEQCRNKTKEPLPVSPFIRKIEYGANHIGYWLHNDMII